MAFSKYANAAVVKPAITMDAWDTVRANAMQLGPAFGARKSSGAVLQKFHPDQYLLSHCTIIASVDTEEPSDVKLGAQMVDGFQINRKYGDYLITPETSPWINNNFDSWERKLLLATYPTFTGGENYVEHLQIPELSKGKILDAAARDIGDSIYVDILVATSRKHRPLIEAVESGELQTLSMGARVAFTICSKCGNVAADETELCQHIKYQKGNNFTDELGKVRKIAEICGHVTAEPGSVEFVEASWVANPAFTGAVLRNILAPDQIKALGSRAQVAFSRLPGVVDNDSMRRVASLAFDLGDQGQDQEEPVPKPQKDLLEEAVGDVADYLREQALKKVREEMGGGEVPEADLQENLNETLVKEATSSPQWCAISKAVVTKLGSGPLTRRILFGFLLYRRGGWKCVQAAKKLKGVDFLAMSRFIDSFQGVPKIAGESRLYRAVVAVGGYAPYEDEKSYLAACRRVLGRELMRSEQDTLLAKGRLYDLGAPGMS
jgi:hypothetical protein